MPTERRPSGPPVSAIIGLLIALFLLVWGVIRGPWWVWLMGASLILLNVSIIRQRRLTQGSRPTSAD